jgi:hypothetical protein
MKRRLLICLGILCWFAAGLPNARSVEAAEAKPSRSQNQMEATVIRVDKYGVYVPNIVFYFDPETGKQKNDALAAAAQKLTSKRATITYSATGELTKDKHPLLVDIAPNRDESKPPPSQAGAGERPVKPPEETFDRKQAATEPPASGRQERAAAGGSLPPSAEAGKLPPIPPVADRTGPIRKEEIVGFIDRCMDATAAKDTNAVMACYADKVDYYARGTVSKEFIRKDKGYYFRNWEMIGSSIEGNVVLIVTDQQDLKIAKFITSFNVRNATKSVGGKAENIWTIQRINGDLKIVDEKQRILKSETWQ